MRFPSNSTFSDEEVQSGSATGFSDGEREEMSKALHRMNIAFDPVTQILDKIDAELVSLTRSQGSSSTATTGTDNTVVRRPDSRQSLESSRQGNGDSLSLSQLGANFKPSVSLHSEQDTGIGTSSLPDSSLQHRSLEPDVRPLEPGDKFREDPGSHHRRSATAPELYLNGHHMSDDDKQKRENQTGSPFEAKHVDDKFKEILQKRKGGFLRNVDDDTQTIRTEDFVDKFQDTLVYSSADEAEKLRNIEDDLHSDGGSDTDTLQRKLAILTHTPIYNMSHTKDGGTRPLPRPKKKLTSSLEIRPRKAAGPGTPPVYPKPTPTTSLPRPSTRSSLKINPGHVSDADSVRTEDFEYKFKDMMINPNSRKEESDLESVSNDPIHTKVKQLLKATAKYKPKPDYKTKPHVRISPKPVQYENEDKGDDSDDTLCSDKHATVSSYRTLVQWDPTGSGWNLANSYSNQWIVDHHRRISKSPSLEDSLSKSSSLSLSHSSLSSSDREKSNKKTSKISNDTNRNFNTDNKTFNTAFSRQVSNLSNATSLPSWSWSELPNSTSVSRCTSTGESMFDDSSTSLSDQNSLSKKSFKDYQYSDTVGPTRRRSSLSESFFFGPYSSKKSGEDTMKTNREKRRHRDIIVQEDDEEEPYPFAKYTFNKKSENIKADDSMSTVSSMSTRSSSQESIFSVGLMKQYVALKNGKVPVMNKRSSSSSMISSLTSSFNDQNVTSLSVEDSGASQDYESFNQDARSRGPKLQYRRSHPNLFLNIPPSPMQNPYNYQMYNFPQVPAPNPEQLLNSMGFNEAQSILPERFLKSWIDKALQTQQEEYMRHMISVPQQPPPIVPSPFYDNPYYVDDSDLPPSISAQQSAATTPQYHTSLENIHGAAKLFKHLPSRMPEKRNLRRSHTFNSGTQNFNRTNGNGFLSNFNDTDPSTDELEDSDFTGIGALPLKKENSFDKLKRILHSSVPVNYREKNFRRSAFAANQQKSLPIFLETLSEEDEEKRRSRTPSFDKNSTKSNSASNMKSFLEEEGMKSHRANSSDNSSDFSVQSSLSSNGESGLLNSTDRCMCSEFNWKCTCLSPIAKKTEIVTDQVIPNENFKMSIPSIIVSEREAANDYSNDTKKQNDIQKSQTEMQNEPLLPRIVEEACSTTSSEKLSRPTSPNPENREEQSIHNSAHNFEIAEIMGSKNKHDKNRKVLGKRRGSKDLDHVSLEWSASKSGQFLRISASESDEKHQHLSPSSSIASPNIMSPVTVIEVHKLDNQNDSLELDEAKASEHKETMHNSSGTVDSKSQTGSAKQVKLNGILDSVSQKSCQKRKKSRKHQAPKCLKLKRHLNDCDNFSGKDSTSDSESVFIDECLAIDKKKHSDIEVQAEDNSLSPIIMISDLLTLLQQLSHSLPELIGRPLFVLAHDRGTQCNMHSGELDRDMDSDKDIKTEKQLIQVECIEALTKSMSVPLNHVDNENELVEINHHSGEDMKDGYSQTEEIDLKDIKNHLVSYKTSLDILKDKVNSPSPKRKFLSVKECFVENSNDLPVSIHVPEVFRSEKTLVLKQTQVTSELSPVVTCDSVPSNTSCQKDPLIVITETTFDIKSERNEHAQNAHEVTSCKKGSSFLDISSEKEHECYSSTTVQKCYENGVNSDKFEYVESVSLQQSEEKRGVKLESRSDWRSSGETDNAEQECDETCKNDELESAVDNSDVKNEDTCASKRENVKNVLLLEKSVNSDIENLPCSVNRDDLESPVINKNLKEIETYVTLHGDDSISQESKVKHMNEKNNIENETKYKYEESGIKKEINQLTENSNVKEAQVYHSECNIYPELDFEKNKGKSENKTKSKLKDTYSCSIFFKLETPSTNIGRELFDQPDNNNVHFIPSFNRSEVERTAEIENQNVHRGITNESDESKPIDKNSISNWVQELVMRKVNDLQNNVNTSDDSKSDSDVNFDYKRIIEDDRDNEDGGVNSCQLLDNVSENTDETKMEGKSVGRKNNMLTKFRALIGHRIDEVETASTKSRENMNSETGDPRSQVISTRSLDFETIGSRKNILHRCIKTGFAKSFEISGVDFKTEETTVTEIRPTNATNNADKLSPESFNDSEIQNSENKETEFEIKDYYQADECDKVMYQVGLNYNDEEECFDVYGRVKIDRDDKSASFNSDSNTDHLDFAYESQKYELKDTLDLAEANIMRLINEEMQGMTNESPIENIFTEMDENKNKSENIVYNDKEQSDLISSDLKNGNLHVEEHGTKTDLHSVKGLGGRQVFDMFQQVVEDEDDFLHDDSVTIVSEHPSGNMDNDTNDSFIEDERTKRTLEKIERLYSLSVYDQDNVHDNFDMEMSDDESMYKGGDYLDNEMKLLDLYHDEYGLTETHMCNNCGHSVAIETTGRYAVGEVVEHDYCCNCAPLKLTVEMLERRRIQRMNEGDDPFS